MVNHTKKHTYRTTRKKNHITHHNKTKKHSYKHPYKQPKKKLKDDFYTTINKNWLHMHKYVYHSTKRDDINRFSLLQEKVDRQIVEIINKICKAHSHSSTPLSNIKKIYDAVIHTESSKVEARLNEYLFQLNNFMKNGAEYRQPHNNHAKYETEYYNFLAWMTHNQFPMFIKWYVDPDVKQTSTYISYINSYGFTYGLKKLYVGKNKHDHKEISDYKKMYIENVDALFHLILGENHCYNAEDIYNVEKQMAEYLYDDNMKITFETSYHKMSVSELKHKFHFDMNKFVDTLVMMTQTQKDTTNYTTRHEKYVVLNNVKYMQHTLNEMYHKWHTKAWQGYFIYKIITSAIPYHKGLCKIYSTFINGINNINKHKRQYLTDSTDNHVFELNNYINIISDDNHNDNIHEFNDDHKLINLFHKTCNPKKIALSNVMDIMNMEINKLYIKYHRHEKEIEFVKKMMESIKNVFRKRLVRSTWLSSNTIKHILQKLDKINIVIGTKPKWDADPDCDFTNDDSYGNYQKYKEWIVAEKINKYFYDEKINILEKYKDRWNRNHGLNTYSVNACFNFDTNELFIPNAILQPPFINIDKSMTYNYANVCTLIGHELMHAFDDQGHKYDENGNFGGSGWWSPEDTKKYKEKQDKLIHFYENVAKKDHIVVSANITIGENIADIGGFLIAEEALVDHLVENKIYGEKQNIYLMEFYKYYAQYWQSIKKPELYKNMNLLNPHSIAKYRVNCVLVTSERFNKIYDIKKNDKMYLNHFEEYHIW
jgi:predicted metalloendopeptidase